MLLPMKYLKMRKKFVLNINKVVCYIVGLTIAVLYGLLLVHGIIPEFINYNVFDLLRISGWAWVIFLGVSLPLGLVFGFLVSNFSNILKHRYEKYWFFLCVFCCVLNVIISLRQFVSEAPSWSYLTVVLRLFTQWFLICWLSILVLKVIVLLRKCYSTNNKTKQV